MPFIGRQPTAIPLSADDLEDNIISTAKIQDNAVTPAKYIEPVPFRNIIINGDMSIAQRGTSESSYTSDGYSTVDRMKTRVGSLGTWTISQSTDVPSGQGFAKSLKWDCTTADASPAASDFLFLEHKIEGQNLQYLKYGNSSAESTILSFWVKSNKTGTGQVNLRDYDNDKLLGGTYTINSADTWEKKTITYIGNTSDTLDNNNAVSLALEFWLDSGSTYTGGTVPTAWETRDQTDRNASGTLSLGDNTSNEWYITGVQLEAGEVASDFEFLPYDVNLNRCLRYYYRTLDDTANESIYGGLAQSGATIHVGDLPVQMRAVPSLTFNTGVSVYSQTANSYSSFTVNANRCTRDKFGCVLIVSGISAGSAILYKPTSGGNIEHNAEL